MNTNELYKLAYETPGLNQVQTASAARRTEAMAEWKTWYESEQKKRQPRKRKNFDPLPEDSLEPKRSELLAKYRVTPTQNRLEDIWASESLHARVRLASQVEFTPDPDCFYIVQKCCVSSYSTQTAPDAYARGELRPLEAKLQALGFEVRVDTHIPVYSGKRYPSSKTYRLWANCLPWMADAARLNITWEEMSWAYGSLNAKVLHPFISHEMLDAHYKRVMQRG